MKNRTGFTRVDLIVAVACVVFVLANVPVIIAAGRGRAKLEVCMANLKILTAAWKTYADDNDGKLVNAAPMLGSPCPLPNCFENRKATASTNPTDDHFNELPWIGLAYGEVCECAEKCAVETGALWKYLRDYSIYRCPIGYKGKLVTYIIVDGANGMREGRGSSMTNAEWNKNVNHIRKNSSKLVFIDEGKITPDSYGVSYGNGGFFPPERWFDTPIVRHGEGTTVSFADGHAEYKKWRAKETVDFARLAEEGGFYGTFPTAHTPELAFQDLYWMQIHCWGKLGYTPTYAPDID